MSFLKTNYKLILTTVTAVAFLLVCDILFEEQFADENQLFREFTEQLFCMETAANTVSLHYTLKEPESYGISDADVTFGTFSTDSTEMLVSLENIQNALDQFVFEELSLENQLTYEILDYYVENGMEGAEYLLYEEPLGTVGGVQTQVPIVLSEYQFYDKNDVDTYLELMQTTPEYFESLIEFEKEKAEAGLFMSDHAADLVLEQCTSFVGLGESNYLYSTFADRVTMVDELSEQEKSAYIQKNASVMEEYLIPAYNDLIEAVQELKGSGTNEGGLCGFAEGGDYYEHMVQNLVGTERTVEEMVNLTRQQIMDDLDSMETIMKQQTGQAYDAAEMMSSAVYAQETASVEESNPVMILNTLEDQIAKTFPAAPKTTVNVKYVPENMEAYMSPAFYMIPAIDNYEENVIYVNRAQMGNSLVLFTTLAHEGYPGHLYQTTYFAGTDADPIRNSFHFGGYVEGWATYAEMCSYYLTPYAKEQATLLQKYNSIMLGIYTLADIGIHYEGWDREDTLQFFTLYGIKDAEVVNDIYDLIIGCPGNYLQYYIGYVEFMELKKQWALEKGDAFSQTEFHKAVLDVGPAPFAIVEKYMWENIVYSY